MKIIRLMDDEAVTSGNNYSEVFSINMQKESRGIVQYQVTVGAGITSTFRLQGRLSEDFEWKDIVGTIKTLAITGAGTNGTGVEDIALYPEIRAKVQVTAGSGTAQVRLGA